MIRQVMPPFKPRRGAGIKLEGLTQPLIHSSPNLGFLPRKGQRHVAWGVSPRKGMPNESPSPEGATADPCSKEDCRRPFGAQGCCGTGYLGLTPQATCRCPFRGKKSDSTTCVQDGGSPRLYARAPAGLISHEPLRADPRPDRYRLDDRAGAGDRRLPVPPSGGARGPVSRSARSSACRSRRTAATSSPPGGSRWSCSRPTWTPCRRSSLPPRTANSSTAGGRATPRVGSPPCSRPPGSCWTRGSAGSACCSSSARRRTALGAQMANRHPRGSRYLINGEPTENRLALGSKGDLYLALAAEGRAAHSAYPELGDSAIDKLVDVLARLRDAAAPCRSRARRDHAQRRHPLRRPGSQRRGGPGAGRGDDPHRRGDRGAAAQASPRRCTPFQGCTSRRSARCRPCTSGRSPASRPRSSNTPPTSPGCGAWGEPFLLGPGSIHVAHTPGERIAKRDVLDAARHYRDMVRRLLDR